MPRSENPGNPDKHHKLTMNLERETWKALEAQAEAEGVEPKDIVRRLIAQSLGLPDAPDGG